jgi:hypothetical protein
MAISKAVAMLHEKAMVHLWLIFHELPLFH